MMFFFAETMVGSYRFHAFSRIRERAIELVRYAVQEHAKQYGLTVDRPDDIIAVHAYEPDIGYRDHQALT